VPLPRPPGGPGKALGAETLYGIIKWPSGPRDDAAIARFTRLRRIFQEMLEDDRRVADAAARGSVHILDIMAGGGVAGAALSSVIAERYAEKVLLTAIDIRSEVRDTEGWLEHMPEAAARKIRVETVVGDVTELPRLLGMKKRWDIALMWGSPLPHLDPYQLLLVYAGLRELQPGHGVVLLEQNNIGPRLLTTNSFEKLHVDEDGLFVYREWDSLRGMAVRLVYRLPSLEYVGVDRVRFWDIADAASMMLVFYRHVGLRQVFDYAGAWVVRGAVPRDTAPCYSELAESAKALLGRGG